MTQSGIEPATYRFIAQSLNHYATARPFFAAILMRRVLLIVRLLWDSNMYKYVGRDSSVDTDIRYGLDGPGIESRWRRGARISATVQTGPGAHPASLQRVPDQARG
jgi:hypothetical protein